MSLTKLSYAMIQGAPVNVLDFGADPTGVTDSNTAILNADATGSKVIYPEGTYKYTSTSNPTFSGGVELNNATVNGPVVTDIFALDDQRNKFVGLHQNYLQSTDKPDSTGVIVEAPMSTASASGPVDLIGHFYNDFGLQGSTGWQGWYTWEWNFVGATSPYTYDPARHPLLGWYHGDDVNTLDWQCYWLREYGVNIICPVGAINTASWSSPTSSDYWKYQLFNNVKNFKGMRYIPWVLSDSGTAATVAANWTGTIYDICGTYKNTYTITQNGKTYLCLFIWDGEALRGILDGFGGSTSAGFTFLSARANEAQVAGYDGICVIARNAGLYSTAWNADPQGSADARKAGFIYIDGGYSGFTGNPESNPSNTTYEDLVNNISFPTSYRCVPFVSTAMESAYPHPSGWTWTGTTPELFQQALTTTINKIADTNQPRIITIYNVSEWAEGGPGLQPDRQNGFGYLEACRNALSESVATVSPTFVYSRADVRSTSIYPGADTVEIWSDTNQTLTGATYHPTIQSGSDGQKVRLICYPNIGNYSITLNSNGYESGTNLFLVLNQITLSPWDSVELQYFSGKGWVQTNNVVSSNTPITVASLPTASIGIAGKRMFVSDSTLTTFGSNVVGGGANKVPVYCDGTNWKIG